MGRFEPPAPFDASTFTYQNFLRLVARSPFFCGEPGVFGDGTEACKRDLAMVFAHAAQETGANDAASSTRGGSRPSLSFAKMVATGQKSGQKIVCCTIQVSWTPGNNAIAQVSNNAGTQGLVTSVGVGSTAINATLSGIQGSTTVSVTGASLTKLSRFSGNCLVHAY